MPDFVPLQAIVQALTSAVAGAQQEVEKAQVANLLSFFDPEYRPLTLQLRVPSLRPEAAPGEEDYYQAPLLSLVPQSTLRIKQVEFSFDVELGDLAKPAPAAKSESGRAPTPVAGLAAALTQSINANPAVSGAVKLQGATAHVVLTIEGVDPSDGVSRLLTDMTKTQGVSGPAAGTPKT